MESHSNIPRKDSCEASGKQVQIAKAKAKQGVNAFGEQGVNAFGEQVSNTLTRLQLGHLVEMPNGDIYHVVYVNESRARVVPTVRKTVTLTSSATGENVTFTKLGASLDISPNSELKIVGRKPVGGRKPVIVKNKQQTWT